MSCVNRCFIFLSFVAVFSSANVHANSVGFSDATYFPQDGQLVVTLVYD